MIAVKLRQMRALGMTVAALFAIALSSCRMCQFTKDDACETECHERAKVCQHPTMHALASDLDYLESQIDKYGSVVAMQPSVWGQARLTKYREEFEKEMLKDLSGFAASLQGSVTRSDQAYLANALAISAAVSGQQAGAAAPPRVMVQTNNAQTAATTPIPVPSADPQTGVFEGFSKIERTPLPGPTKIGFAGANAGISLEPTIVLDQKARYLNHLNQLRRNNEGDDTADSPGYSLNLVRVPVSVLPGKCTLKGYGAEITMTLTPQISDELLPTTFQQMVINDLTDQLSLPLTKVIEDEKGVDEIRCVLKDLDERYYKKLDDERRKIASSNTSAKEHTKEWREQYIKAKDDPRYKNREAALKADLTRDRNAKRDPKEDFAKLREKQLKSMINVYSASSQRISPFSVPLSQLFDVYGVHTLAHVVDEVYDTVANHLNAADSPYYLEVKSVLRDELAAAYRLLSLDQNQDLWEKHCTTALVEAIRNRHEPTIERLLTAFFDDLNSRKPSLTHSGTDALAWAIIVESALLNVRLKHDIGEATAAKGRPVPAVDGLNFFYPNPGELEKNAFREYVETRWPIHVFAVDPITQDQNLADAYSRRQEMQLALSLAFASGNMNARNMTRYARRLEEDMQTIAINRTQVGFSHGSNTFGWRFYPRFQTPEFQSNATSLFRDQLIGGPSKNAEIKQMRLEPGMRECVAIVMMPSFVPYVKCEVSSNWFKLTNPKHKEFTLTDAVRLGRVVKSVYNCEAKVKNADCYRDGDLGRLMAKTKQLEARLPLQDMMVQVPYENTLGGFEMFNTGITDLAPQLRGWYGGPGIQAGAPTQLFLVGDHFSVHHTIVTAGGQDVPFELISRQIMRVTIPKGTMANTRKEGSTAACDAAKPEGKAAKDKTEAPAPTKTSSKYVDVHVATPYGVTAHLEIPLVEPEAKADLKEAKTGLSWNLSSVEVGFAYSGLGIGPCAPPQVWPPLVVKMDPKTLQVPASAAAASLEMVFANPYADDKTDLKITIPVSFPASKNEMSIDSAKLATELFRVFNGFFTPRKSPVPVKVSKATLTFLPAAGTKPVAVIGDLTFTWQFAVAGGSGQSIMSCPPATMPFPPPVLVPCLPLPAKAMPPASGKAEQPGGVDVARPSASPPEPAVALDPFPPPPRALPLLPAKQ